MLFDVKVPAVGESVNEGVILTWFKKEGEQINVDDALFELETDKITLTVPAESSGVLSIKKGEGEEVEVGEVVASIDSDATAVPSVASVASTPAVTDVDEQSNLSEIQLPSLSSEEQALLSPAARPLVLEHGIDISVLSGSGKHGLILKEDILRFIESKKQIPNSLPVASSTKTKVDTFVPRFVGTEPEIRQTRHKMTPIRKRIAQRLIQAQQTAAILTTFNEVDMTNVMALRKKYQDSFVKKHGHKLGFMSFFVKAVVEALKTVPAINGSIDGDEIVQNHFYDIGIAVGTERGLVVPVVRNADLLSFSNVEVEIGHLAKKAREKKLTLDELTGGSFTITNGGVYGSLLSTPILNPPQSGILGMHGIKRRPVAVGDHVEIRPMMYLALSYDHRLVDGSEAVTFLKRVVECIENPERIMLDV